MIAQILAAPLALGSLWALLPAIAAAYLYILRTRLEDQMLKEQLPGYDTYARRVRFRLVPGIWLLLAFFIALSEYNVAGV